MNPVGQLWGEYADAGRSFSRAARLCLAAGFLVWLGRGIQGVLFNLYLVAGGFEEAFVGQALGMAGLGLATAAIPAGLLADRLGRRRCLMLGALVEAAGALGRACLLHPSGILAASFVLGAGQSLFTVAALPYLTEHSTPRERTHLFSAVLSVNLLAWVVGSAAGGVLPSALRAALGDTLVGEPIAYRGVLVLAALCATAAWVPLALLRGLTERSTPSQRTGELRDSARRLAPIALNFLLIGCGAGLVVPFMNLSSGTVSDARRRRSAPFSRSRRSSPRSPRCAPLSSPAGSARCAPLCCSSCCRCRSSSHSAWRRRWRPRWPPTGCGRCS